MATLAEPTSTRKGRVVSLQLDHDALQMLHEIAPTHKSYGRYLSELVRRDYVRRQEWQRMRQAMMDGLGDPVGAVHE